MSRSTTMVAATLAASALTAVALLVAGALASPSRPAAGARAGSLPDVEFPERVPIHYTVAVTIPAGSLQRGQDVAAVPDNQRFVIEQIASLAVLRTGQRPRGTLSTMLYRSPEIGGAASYPLLYSFQQNLGGDGFYEANQQVRLYADPGTVVRIIGTRGPATTGNAVFTVSVSGYLVEVGV